MNVKNIAIGTGVVGTATLITALGLQFAYEKTDFYPPEPVFYFATGAAAFLILELSGLHKKLEALTV